MLISRATNFEKGKSLEIPKENIDADLEKDYLYLI